MKKNPVLYAQMEQFYQRFAGAQPQQSNLSRHAFCKVEGLYYSLFSYWCKRLAKEKRPINFKQLNLSASTTPLMVLELAGKGRY